MEATLTEERAAAAAAAAQRSLEEREVLQVLQEDNFSIKQQLSDMEKELEAKKREKIMNASSVIQNASSPALSYLAVVYVRQLCVLECMACQ